MSDGTKIILIAAISLIFGTILTLYFTSEELEINTPDQKTVLKNAENTQIPTFPKKQEQSEGGVTVTATYLDPDHDEIQFDITMNTHSVSLENYELDKIAYLQDNKGNKYKPLKWDSSGNDHHISGTLAFPLVDSDKIILVIPDIAGSDREFTWQ